MSKETTTTPRERLAKLLKREELEPALAIAEEAGLDKDKVRAIDEELGSVKIQERYGLLPPRQVSQARRRMVSRLQLLLEDVQNG